MQGLYSRNFVSVRVFTPTRSHIDSREILELLQDEKQTEQNVRGPIMESKVWGPIIKEVEA